MPIYEFVCKQCGHPFEKWVRYGEDINQQECPECHSRETQKRITIFSTSTNSSTSSSSSSSCGGGTSGFR